MSTLDSTPTIAAGNISAKYFPLTRLAKYSDLHTLPFTYKILLESVLRNIDNRTITEGDLQRAAGYDPSKPTDVEIPFKPARVILQDFTGVPAIVDLAAMRDAVKRLGGDPKKINPLIPVDLVIDHSVQVDAYGTGDALAVNMKLEFERNRERYEFLHWGQRAFQNFRVVPPATGIVHQVNLEYLSKVVMVRDGLAYPDTVLGTDSHTTMVNGLGVVAWGVGGIEAEAAMLGQPGYMSAPEIIGFRLHGKLREGVTSTDLVLTITQILRKRGVVGKFVEFFGPALDSLSLPTRAMIGNMTPEFGATVAYFPVDLITLDYLRLTGRSADEVALVEAYCRAQGLFRENDGASLRFTDRIELDLSSVEPSLSGPKRPQDRVPLSQMKQDFAASLTKPVKDRGYELKPEELQKTVTIGNGTKSGLGHGAVVIAAITSCTNTSDPSVLVAAGLLARNAAARGLRSRPYVKTSLAPGSRVVATYLERAGLLAPLEQLGFNIVGFGCTTCIGNSGPLSDEVTAAITDGNLVAAAVLSGNRNFEGRVHPNTRANYLASPPLVVAYALAGTVDIDLVREPIGKGSDGAPVYLKDIWPTDQEIQTVIGRHVTSDIFTKEYAAVFDGNPTWNAIPSTASELFPWNEQSTYIQQPPFFLTMEAEPGTLRPITDARVLVMVGDSVTTDHISPAGSIKKDSPAGSYLESKGVGFADFNSYGSRRGNDRVMTRGTFANIRLRNLLVPGSEGNVTRHLPDGTPMSIYDAAMKYQQEHCPLIVLAGKDYGMGSSRDWAAKGTLLLGVRAVIAESYERIHRSNLVGMGVLPLEYLPGENRESLGLTGEESFTIAAPQAGFVPRSTISVIAKSPAGEKKFSVRVRIDTIIEVSYYLHGGLLPMVIRQLARG